MLPILTECDARYRDLTDAKSIGNGLLAHAAEEGANRADILFRELGAVVLGSETKVRDWVRKARARSMDLVSARGNPFKVFDTIVCGVAVDVIDLMGICRGASEERLRYQPMNRSAVLLVLAAEIDVQASLPNARTEHAWRRPPWQYYHAPDVPKTAHFVQGELFDLAPLFHFSIIRSRWH